MRSIKMDAGKIVEGLDMANQFNTYFTGIVSRITEMLPREVNFDYLRSIDRICQSQICLISIKYLNYSRISV